MVNVEREGWVLSLDHLPASPAPDDDTVWEKIRSLYFSCDSLNLNLGNLGTASQWGMQTRQAFTKSVWGSPLLEYQAGRAASLWVRELAGKIWPVASHEFSILPATTMAMNLIALAMSRRAKHGHPVKVLTSRHEHYGGVSVFEKHPDFMVSYFDDHTLLEGGGALGEAAREAKPDLIFLSHISWDRGNYLVDQEVLRTLRNAVPGALMVLDVAQSLGIQPLLFEGADLVLGSAHKWLLGPRGLGLCWHNARARHRLGPLNWSGHSLLEDEEGYALSGGVDFPGIAELGAALAMMLHLGPENLKLRSELLGSWLAAELQSVGFLAGKRLLGGPPSHLVYGDAAWDPYPFYQRLNELNIYVKCIKLKPPESTLLGAIRLGVPWYESPARLRRFVDAAAAYQNIR